MNFGQIALQLYQTGILALAIIFLGLVILAYPTLKSRPHRSSKR